MYIFIANINYIHINFNYQSDWIKINSDLIFLMNSDNNWVYGL